MREPISGILVEYGIDGDYLSPPVALPANVVLDDVYGRVVEIVLPNEKSSEERAILFPLAELQKL